MSTDAILNRINEIIVEEKGHPVVLEGLFSDAQLDSLGTMITFVTIDAEYDIFQGSQTLEDIDIKNLTMRDLVAKCISSNTSTSLEQNSETDT